MSAMGIILAVVAFIAIVSFFTWGTRRKMAEAIFKRTSFDSSDARVSVTENWPAVDRTGMFTLSINNTDALTGTDAMLSPVLSALMTRRGGIAGTVVHSAWIWRESTLKNLFDLNRCRIRLCFLTLGRTT